MPDSHAYGMLLRIAIARRCALSLSLLALTSCGIAPNVRQDDAIARALVGQWEWIEGDPDCPRDESWAFRTDGTYTVTSSSCSLESDGFGFFSYGWYIADGHVCFADIAVDPDDRHRTANRYKQQFLSKVAAGFDSERCRWRVEKVLHRSIEIARTDESGESFVMERSRWLCGALSALLRLC